MASGTRHRRLTGVVVGFVALLAAAVAFEAAFRWAVPEPMVAGCPEVWAHRGARGTHPQNSLGSLSEAFDRGAPGVELDVHFDAPTGVWVVSHNTPYARPDGRLLTLERVFDALGSRGRFWLDVKNLPALSDEQVEQAVERLREVTSAGTLRSRVIVESPSGWKLARFSRSGFHTSYWVLPEREFGRDGDSIARRAWKRARAFAKWRWHLVWGRHSAVSMHYRDYASLRDAFPNRALHTFTVNEADRMAELLEDPNVGVVLTDDAALYGMRGGRCRPMTAGRR